MYYTKFYIVDVKNDIGFRIYIYNQTWHASLNIKDSKLFTNSLFMYIYIYIYIYRHYIAKSIGPPLLMKGLTTLVISMSTNLNV